MVSLTIDGKTATVAEGTTILDAAATVGITIPTLCWLQKVSPTGACRICAVEIEGIDRPVTACNTPVKEGINVTTVSENLDAVRRKVTELLLVNHPLDCPVCDAAGECDLQDTCYNMEVTKQEYYTVLERRTIRYDWPLIESDPNRCILCEKCVKVDHEIVGADAIAVTNCGDATIIETDDGKALKCEFCGNCVAVCPTGTLISKPFKFKGRPWTYNKVRSICGFCPAGCQIEYHVKDGRIDRVTSDDATTFNSGNLCINGRFGYSYINSTERLTAPLLKAHDRQLATDWEKAMSFAARKLQEIVKDSGPQAVAGIGSPRLTNEESFLFQKFMTTAIGTGNLASEVCQGYGAAVRVLQEKLGISGASATIDKIDDAEAILVIGTDLNAEATGVEYRVIKAATKNDAKLILANMRPVKLKKFANKHLQYQPGGELPLIGGLIKAVVEQGGEVNGLDAVKQSVASSSLSELAAAAGVLETDLREAAQLVSGKKSVAIIFGSDITKSAGAAEKVAALANLALVTGAVGKEAGGVFPIDEKNNAQGVLDMSAALGGGSGKSIEQLIEGIEQGVIKALYVVASDLLVSFPDSGKIRKALEKLDLLIVQDIFPSETVKLADVVFAGSAAAEKEGTFTTIDNRVQSLSKAVRPPGDARSDIEILADLYRRVSGTEQSSAASDILSEISTTVPGYATACESDGCFIKSSNSGVTAYCGPLASLSDRPVATAQYPLTLLAGSILYHNGTTSTWSENNLAVAPQGYVELSATDASALGIGEGSAVKVSSAVGSITAPARVNGLLQPGLVFAPIHFRDVNVNALLENGNMTAVKVEKA
ncbi:molybdopterin-dependent oxidoreductase [Geobacter sp. DSM 9736]|uniref:molybdopterin-dependent oxidoreductase n=1 Tax=Geobacter sp. DSM 9736 TaxID=1277350 RepID=UPI000B502602|nr:molybdopterin-dependent oxidoreductase [Geobacter sp. DSM 9736]SNB48009.1 formate dehydrogenase alpha subunit [Geobacter sp. DSM 9736]